MIPANYRNVYQLVMKIFESDLLSPTYFLHNVKWKYSQYLRLYLRTEFKKATFSF